jgi:uncharacterized membrane protein
VTDQLVVSLIYLIVISVGASIPFAILVAQPFATLLVLSVYRERVGGSSERERISEYDAEGPPQSPPPVE